MKYEDRYHPSDQLIFRSLEEGEFDITSHKLISLRERRFSKDHCAHLHYHNTLEINVNKGVSGTVWIDGNKEDLSQNPILVTPPGMMHSFDFKGGDGSFEVLHISLTILERYIKLETLFGGDFNELRELPYKSREYSLLIDLVGEMKEADDDDLFTQLQIILKILKVLFAGKGRAEEKNRSNGILKSVIDYTEKNYAGKIDLDEISAFAGLSRSYFSRYFKKATGTGYFTYLTLMRLERAKEMIRHGESVTESCLACGFENISYFIQLFKKHNNGISPGKYRETL